MASISDIDMPESITPDYQAVVKERVRLDEDEREAFLHDVSHLQALWNDYEAVVEGQCDTGLC